MSPGAFFQQTDLVDEFERAVDEHARLLEMMVFLDPILHEFGRNQLRSECLAMRARAQRVREELYSIEPADDHAPIAA